MDGHSDWKLTLLNVLSAFSEKEMWHLGYSESGPQQQEGEGPGARHAHSAVVHDQAMWVFGGMCDLQPRNDFWKWSFGKIPHT